MFPFVRRDFEAYLLDSTCHRNSGKAETSKGLLNNKKIKN
jgi:hypothetical protein